MQILISSKDNRGDYKFIRETLPHLYYLQIKEFTINISKVSRYDDEICKGIDYKSICDYESPRIIILKQIINIFLRLQQTSRNKCLIINGANTILLYYIDKELGKCDNTYLFSPQNILEYNFLIVNECLRRQRTQGRIFIEYVDGILSFQYSIRKKVLLQVYTIFINEPLIENHFLDVLEKSKKEKNSDGLDFISNFCNSTVFFECFNPLNTLFFNIQDIKKVPIRTSIIFFQVNNFHSLTYNPFSLLKLDGQIILNDKIIFFKEHLIYKNVNDIIMDYDYFKAPELRILYMIFCILTSEKYCTSTMKLLEDNINKEYLLIIINILYSLDMIDELYCINMCRNATVTFENILKRPELVRKIIVKILRFHKKQPIFKLLLIVFYKIINEVFIKNKGFENYPFLLELQTYGTNYKMEISNYFLHINPEQDENIDMVYIFKYIIRDRSLFIKILNRISKDIVYEIGFANKLKFVCYEDFEGKNVSFAYS